MWRAVCAVFAGPMISIESPGDGVAIWGPTDVEVCVAAYYVIDPMERLPELDSLHSSYAATVVLIDKARLTVRYVSFPLDLGEERCRTLFMDVGGYAIRATLREDSSHGPAVDADRIDFVVVDPHD